VGHRPDWVEIPRAICSRPIRSDRCASWSVHATRSGSASSVCCSPCTICPCLGPRGRHRAWRAALSRRARNFSASPRARLPWPAARPQGRPRRTTFSLRRYALQPQHGPIALEPLVMRAPARTMFSGTQWRGGARESSCGGPRSCAQVAQRALKAAWRRAKPIGALRAAGGFVARSGSWMERDELYAALESVHGEADWRRWPEPDRSLFARDSMPSAARAARPSCAPFGAGADRILPLWPAHRARAARVLPRQLQGPGAPLFGTCRSELRIATLELRWTARGRTPHGSAAQPHESEGQPWLRGAGP